MRAVSGIHRQSKKSTSTTFGQTKECKTEPLLDKECLIEK